MAEVPSHTICEAHSCDFFEKCYEGKPTQEECANHQLGEQDVAQEDTSATQEPTGLPIPWPGSAYGQHNLHHLSAQRRPKMVAIVGRTNAGKTSFLGSLYGLLLKGETLKNHRFAGSFTLEGWEAIASNMRWKADFYPHFPPHTPRGERIPGLLHLAFLNQNKEFRDVLFTDAAGEWFEKWQVSVHDPMAEGARWIMHHADMVVFFIDVGALMESPGLERNHIQTLLGRVKSHLQNRPLLIVWAKHDVFVKNANTDRLQTFIQANVPQATQIHITSFTTLKGKTKAGENVMTCAQWIVDHLQNEKAGGHLHVPPSGEHPFLWFRGEPDEL